jgi:Kef-type K+ transport system membrane component KefB
MVLLSIFQDFTTTLIFDIGIIIIIATIFAYFAKIFKQPLIPAYIITGVIIGPLVLGLIKDTEIIRVLSEFGIAFLLFLYL